MVHFLLTCVSVKLKKLNTKKKQRCFRVLLTLQIRVKIVNKKNQKKMYQPQKRIINKKVEISKLTLRLIFVDFFLYKIKELEQKEKTTIFLYFIDIRIGHNSK